MIVSIKHFFKYEGWLFPKGSDCMVKNKLWHAQAYMTYCIQIKL